MSHPSTIDLRNVNALWASVLVETLVRCGVRHAVVSPGSRSTPLTIACARHPGLSAIPVLDERSAAFFALGISKRTRVPVVLVCTSGTAGANYFPAIIEARESAVPLIVITADRPPEMRACASGQTIDQQKLFGGYVSFFHELALPEPGESLLRYLRQNVLHAVHRALRPTAGPVHLNAPFRDPLPPLPDDGQTARVVHPIEWEQFFAHLQPPTASAHVAVDAPRLVPEAHGAIVVGPDAGDGDELAAIAACALRLGWPVITDGLSAVRNRADVVPHLVTTADVVLRNATVAERLTPEVIIAVGSWPTSKVVRGWIERSGARILLVSDRADNRDALHGRTQPIGSLVSLVSALPAASEESAYQRLWARYEQKARAALDARMTASDELFEGRAAWTLGRALPAGTPVFVANSMPVRDVEYFWPANDRGVRPFVSRGANGIDGTLSTALGVAHEAGKPAVLLTGDLALLHDTNGFLLASRLRGGLTIVLINNRGGGIFEHLPVAQFEPPFEEFFATPQSVNFATLCAAYGVEHRMVATWGEFEALIATLPERGVRVLELPTDRKRDAARRKQWFAEIAAGLG